MARPQTPFDKDTVKKLAAIGCTAEEIAVVVGVSKDTIERRARGELADGRAEGRASLRRKQWAMAMNGDRTMLVWLGKQMLGQTDRQAIEHSGAIDLGSAALSARQKLERLKRSAHADG